MIDKSIDRKNSIAVYEELDKNITNEANNTEQFQTISSDELFDKQIRKRKHIVEGLLPEGLALLSADPKAGKSFFALGMCVAVARGMPFLCFPTKQSDVLYFCYEDDEIRLQKRLYAMTDESFTGLTFSTEVKRLDDQLIERLELYLREHTNTKLIVFDTLNYIRPIKTGMNVYKNDYDDMIALHRFAQKYNIAILLVHHTRKGGGKNQVESVSGSAGLTGGVDTCISIEHPREDSKIAMLSVVSRDIERIDLKIVQGNGGVWMTVDNAPLEEAAISDLVKAVYLFLALNNFQEWPVTISPTELSRQLKEMFLLDVPINMIKKNLTAEHEDLESFGVKFESKRTCTERLLIFYKTEDFKTPEYVYYNENGQYLLDCFFDQEQFNSSNTSDDDVDAYQERGISCVYVGDNEHCYDDCDNFDDSDNSDSCDGNDGCDGSNNSDSCDGNDGCDGSDNSDGNNGVTADPRCQTSCHAVIQASNGSSNKKKSSGKHKKKGGKKKHGKKH